MLRTGIVMLFAGLATTGPAGGLSADDRRPPEVSPQRKKIFDTIADEKPTRIILRNADGQLQVLNANSLDQRRIAVPPGVPVEELRQRLRELEEASGDPERLKELIAKLRNDVQQRHVQAVPTFGIGVSLVHEFPAALRAQLKLAADAGVLVQSVAEDSPAAKSGVREHDILLEVDGDPIREHAGLVQALQQAGEAGKPVQLTVLSGGEQRTVEVQPTATADIAWSFDIVKPGQEPNPWRTLPDSVNQLEVHTLPPGVVSGVPLWVAPPGYPPPNARVVEAPGAVVRDLEQRIRELEASLEQLSGQIEKLNESK